MTEPFQGAFETDNEGVYETDYVMRRPCAHCGHEYGYVTQRNGQACVFCSKCNSWCYNRPKHENGERPKSLRSNAKIKPSVRERVIERARRRCELCGKCPADTDGEMLHVDHMLSVIEAESLSVDPAIYNSEENYMALCGECNLGKGKFSVEPVIYLNLIRARAMRGG